MKHTNNIKSCNISNEELAKEIGDLYYDNLSEFLEALADKLEKDSLADNKRGRKKLATSLMNASINIRQSVEDIDYAWKVSKPEVEKWFEDNGGHRV